MKRSSTRILTTHTGSLIRPPQLLEFVRKRNTGEQVDEGSFEKTLKESENEVVARQLKAGIDVPNDGEYGKSTSWAWYVLKRLSGFEMRDVKASPFDRGGDRQRFMEFYADLES
jgi:5-methyltetrahydropteroyltriglutamate--homocysteine methyltransferase